MPKDLGSSVLHDPYLTNCNLVSELSAHNSISSPSQICSGRKALEIWAKEIGLLTAGDEKYLRLGKKEGNWDLSQVRVKSTAAVDRCECLRELARTEVEIPTTWRWQQILLTIECTKSVPLNDKKVWETFINTASFLWLLKTFSTCSSSS